MVEPNFTDTFQRYLRSRGLPWPAKFSCNAQGEAWLVTRRGPVPKEERTYVNDVVFDILVTVVLEHRSSGGRFEVTDEGLFLLGDAALIEWADFIDDGPDASEDGGESPPQQLTGPRRGGRESRIHIAPIEQVQALVPDLDLHMKLGNVHNPEKGPLSQGGDT